MILTYIALPIVIVAEELPYGQIVQPDKKRPNQSYMSWTPHK